VIQCHIDLATQQVKLKSSCVLTLGIAAFSGDENDSQCDTVNKFVFFCLNKDNETI